MHGDATGTENLRRILTDWLCDIGLIPAGHYALIDQYVGYRTHYATSHDDLDADKDFQENVQTAARALVEAVKLCVLASFPSPTQICTRRGPNKGSKLSQTSRERNKPLGRKIVQQRLDLLVDTGKHRDADQ